jgi:NTE family protein
MLFPYHPWRIFMGSFRIGLALSGGTAKSSAHIGVLRALEEHGIEIDCMSATSGGAIIAALYAAGKPVSEIERLADGMQWWQLAGLTLPRLGFLSGDKISEFIVDQIGDIEFKDLDIPTVIVAADLTGNRKVVFSEGRIAIACQASSSIPQIYRPVEIQGHSIVDGALIEYMPVESLASFGKVFRLGINIGKSEMLSRRRPKHFIEVIMQVTDFVSQFNAEISEREADFVICPDLGRFNPFALHKAPEMIEKGYRAAVESMPDLKRAIRRHGSFASRTRRRFGRG